MLKSGTIKILLINYANNTIEYWARFTVGSVDT